MLKILISVLQPFGTDLFCIGKKFLVFNLVGRNLKVKYRRSILGVLWTLLTPMAMALIYFLVFNLFLKIKIPHYLAFILSGVIPFNFFSQSIMEGMESIVGNGGLATKIPIPLQIFPYVGTITNLVTLFLAIPILLLACYVSKVDIGMSLVLLPVMFVVLFLITYGLALLLAVLFVFFRDLRHLMGILLQLWFYGTPVIYPHQMIPEKYKFLLFANPLGSVFVCIRSILVEGILPEPVFLFTAFAWAVGIVLFSAFVYRKTMNSIVEQI